MKKVTIAIMASIICMGAYCQATVKGKLVCNDASKTQIEVTSQHPVEFYAQFKSEMHHIRLIFEGTGLQTSFNTGKEEPYSLIEFTSIIFFNGKQIDLVKRKPFPFFPGDMLMPIETFDAIPSLQQFANKYGGLLPLGNYEIRLQAKSTDARGTITGALINFKLSQ
jgi:hypothetical protein